MPLNEDLWYEDGIDVREDEHDELTDEDFELLYEICLFYTSPSPRD